MSGLKRKYKGKVTFAITRTATPEGQAALKKYDFGTPAHGLVCLEANGEVSEIIPGHSYAREDIEFEADRLLE